MASGLEREATRRWVRNGKITPRGPNKNRWRPQDLCCILCYNYIGFNYIRTEKETLKLSLDLQQGILIRQKTIVGESETAQVKHHKDVAKIPE